MGVVGLVKKFTVALAISVPALLWSVVVVLGVIYRCIRKGFRPIFYYKDRTKDRPPFHYVAWDESSRNSPGDKTRKWNHGYVTVPETGVRFHYVYSGRVPDNLVISAIDGETTIRSAAEITSKPQLLLCAHGYPENWFSWRYILRYFDDPPEKLRNYFVVAIDLRGYGDTDKPSGYKSYHINNLVCDIREVANALGYEKFVLAGHDWGGAITWNVARIYPEILEKVIILNCPEGRAIMKTAVQVPKQILKSWYVFFFQMPYLPELMTRLSDYKLIESAFNGRKGGIMKKENRLTKEEVEVFKYSFRQSCSGPINYYRALLWPFAHPGPVLRYPRNRVKDPLHSVPILLIWGTGDQFLSKQAAANSKGLMNEENGSKVVYIDGASHWVQQDAPEETIRHIVDFLKAN